MYTFRDRKIHYESHGTGKPLLILNGIMMSTANWLPFLPAFLQGGHRVILVDLMDQGKSESFEEGYQISDQAEMVAGLLAHLGLPSASVMGTSYGGAVALSLTIMYPQRVDRLLLAGTRAYTDPMFRDMCEGWMHSCHSPESLYTATMPLFYGATFQQEQEGWLAARRELLQKTAFSNPAFLKRFGRLLASIMVFDLRDRLQEIKVPTLVLSPSEDLVMMPWEQQRIAEGIKGAHLVTLHKTGHVMFLERPDLFIPLMMGWFCHTQSISLP